MPGPHRKMVMKEEGATVRGGEGEEVAREARAQRAGRGDWVDWGAQGWDRQETATAFASPMTA